MSWPSARFDCRLPGNFIWQCRGTGRVEVGASVISGKAARGARGQPMASSFHDLRHENPRFYPIFVNPCTYSKIQLSEIYPPVFITNFRNLNYKNSSHYILVKICKPIYSEQPSTNWRLLWYTCLQENWVCCSTGSLAAQARACSRSILGCATMWTLLWAMRVPMLGTRSTTLLHQKPNQQELS